MAKSNATTGPQVALQSKDHEELLDIIDHLRGQGISRYIDLPQLIVCGDQSSGKSSVLEAVSGLQFPTKDNLCTRFATELILRRGPENTVTVTIVPDDRRNEEETQKLQAFRSPTTALDDFLAIIGAAEHAMGLDYNKKAFSTDILRVEITGPKQPHLTLVDLPGLFHASNKAQSEEDGAAIKSLVLYYMKKPRGIILAVVSAKNDYANQIVTTYARQLDREGSRTLGIITKPDMLHAGSDSERAFVELAENKDVNFRLGWHVLKNRDYDNRDSSAEERDQAEAEFFSQGIWTSLPPSHVGIGSLRPRLSRVLQDQILTELPSLIQDVDNGVKDCKGRLEVLGVPRATIQEQRLYLLRVSQKFSSLVQAAIDGVYVHSFFGDPKSEDEYSKRLRAVVQNTLTEFSDDIRQKGHAKTVGADTMNSNEEDSYRGGPMWISRAAYMEEVQDLMKRTKGCELPGTFNPSVVGELFFRQSKPWKGIVDGLTARLLEATRTTLHLIVDYAADSQTADGLLRYVINPAMEPIKDNLEKIVQNVLEPHQGGHPITYNHYLTDNIQRSRQNYWYKTMAEKAHGFFGTTDEDPVAHHHSVDVRSLLQTLTSVATEVDMDRYACSEAIACMKAYYKVAMKTLVDTFSTLSIEKCLLQKLPDIFCPEVVLGLGDSVLERIAAETQDSKAERLSSTKKLEALEATLKLLNRLDRHRPRKDLAETVTNSEGIETPPEEPEEELEDCAEKASLTDNLEAAAAVESSVPSPPCVDDPVTEDVFAGFMSKKDTKRKKATSKRVTTSQSYDDWP